MPRTSEGSNSSPHAAIRLKQLAHGRQLVFVDAVRHAARRQLVDDLHHPRAVEAHLGKLGRHTVGTDLVELVDGDERRILLASWHGCGVEHRKQHAPVVHTDERAVETESPERVAGRRQQLELGADAGFAEDVDVALHELAEAALLRALGAPHRSDLHSSEHRRQACPVRRVEPGERHRQVEAQAEVGQVDRVGSLDDVVGRDAALHDAERQLLVIAAEPRVQPCDVFDDGRLDLGESVRGERLADRREHALATALLSGQEVAHAARGNDVSCHAVHSFIAEHFEMTVASLARKWPRPVIVLPQQ